MNRRILLCSRPGRPELQPIIESVARRLREVGVEPVMLAPQVGGELGGLVPDGVDVADPQAPAADCELVFVLGGDGTILRGAEIARAADVPLLGVNFGHVGFLAEAEPEDLPATVDRIVERRYRLEERMTLDVCVYSADQEIARSWALNEATVEKAERERMLELTLEVDGRPISTWGCDGIIMSTPSGSTAYAFSAGGPIVWPHVEALSLVPISAHALFARPLVVGGDTRVAVELLADAEARAVLWCDGARPLDLPSGARIEVTRGERPVRLVRLDDAPFADRLVEKFDLPVEGWRGRRRHQG